jgi:hypothetical protein
MNQDLINEQGSVDCNRPQVCFQVMNQDMNDLSLSLSLHAISVVAKFFILIVSSWTIATFSLTPLNPLLMEQCTINQSPHLISRLIIATII